MLPGLIHSAYEYNYWDNIGSFISALITLVGIFYAYQKNDGKDGYDFIHKYIVLGWVVLVRFTLCFIPIFILLIIIGVSSGLHSSKATGPYMVIIISLSQIVFYQRLGKHIRDTIKDS